MKKIAVVGCGAVGLNYGTRLLESELFAGDAKVQQSIDVSLVVRRDYELLTSHGVRVKYGRSGCSEMETSDLLLSGENLRGKVYPTTQALFSCKGCMTWIIVCCKSYSICSQFLESLECIADDSTKFLIIMNGLDVESSFVEWFGAGRVFGGLAKIACNRGPNPPQLEPGPLVLQCFADISLEIGHVLDDELLLCEARQLFANTAISSIVQVTSNLLRSRWDKLCWNITFTGISVAMGGLTCDVIVGDASLRTLAARVIADVVRVANADLRRQHQQRTRPCPDLNLMPEEETIARLLAITEQAGAYKTSTVLDLVDGRPMEAQQLFEIPLQRARQLQSTFDDTLHFEYMESVVLMVLAAAGLSRRKKDAGIAWVPVFFSGDAT